MTAGEPQRPAGPSRGFALFVLISSLASGLTGGVVATALARLGEAPARPSPVVAVATSLDVTAAAEAVMPAVVTVLIGAGATTTSGTGVVIDSARGYIVTSSHVVQLPRSTRPSSDVTILLGDGRTLGATVLGNDVNTDVAVLKADGPLPAQAVLSTDTVPIGAQVIAIGTPGSSLTSGSLTNTLSNTVTGGIVSATGRRIPREDVRNVVLTDLIQTDASIGSGMSGGPLVLVSTRQVIGLNTFTIRSEADLGFAISAATVRRVADEIITKTSP